MASKFGAESIARHRDVKELQAWACDKHNEPISFYCNDHKATICILCAMKDHQQPCQLDDIEDAKKTFDEEKKRLKRMNSKTQSCSTIQDEVDITYKDKIKSIKDKAREKICLIVKGADEDIKLVNEEMEKQIKLCRMEAEKQQQNIHDTEDKTKNKQKDNTLVNEAPQVTASLAENEGKVGTRINGFTGKLEVAKSINIQSIIGSPSVRGLISNDEICVTNNKNMDVFVLNITNESIQKVIEGDINISITSCAPVDNNLVVCGKWLRTTDNFAECITLYNKQWKVVRHIKVPRNTSFSNCAVYVDVDKKGLILAGEFYQPNIYVISAADGKIVNTITMQGNVVRGAIQALSSGNIVVKTDVDEFTIISRSGEMKSTKHCVKHRDALCHVDKTTDTLYMTYPDHEGNIKAGTIANFCPHYQSLWSITPSGKLIGCDGGNILVTYKKKSDV